MQNAQQFFDIDLLEELELLDLPGTQSIDLLASISDALMTTIIGRVLPMLSEEEQKSFEALLQTTNDMQQLHTFLSERIPQLNEIIAEETARFKTEALAFYKAML